MATKNFNRMTTAKLQAALADATTTNEEREAINEVLAKRGVAEAPAEAPAAGEMSMSEAEMEEVYKQAEANGGLNPLAPKAAPKVSEEELEALAEKCRENVNHKCQIVPFNTVEWKDGIITGVNVDKRSCRVLYSIRLEDGRTIKKVHNASLLKISDEVVDSPVKARTSRRTEKTEVTDEQREEMRQAVIQNVGKMYTAGDESGRIIGILWDKRHSKYLYRTQRETINDMGDIVKVDGFKSSTLPGLVINPDLDEYGASLNAKAVSGSLGRPTQKTLEELKADAEKLRAKLASLEAEIARREAEATEAPASETTEDMM